MSTLESDHFGEPTLAFAEKFALCQLDASWFGLGPGARFFGVDGAGERFACEWASS